MREYNFESNEPKLSQAEQQQLDEELARRVISEVHHLEESDDDEAGDSADDDDLDDPDQADEPQPQEPTQRRFRRRAGLFWMVISGNVLIWKGLTRYYGQMILIALLFLVSIVVMFWSLHLDMEYTHISRNVQLLRERSVRLQEVRSARLSHSAIVKELERRGIELYDPTTPATVIEKRGFWR